MTKKVGLKMERLQKVIAQAGIASRRKAEELIQQGRVKVNGKIITEMGYKVRKKDEITVDEKSIEKESKVYFIINKPKKTICSNFDDGRTTVVSLIQTKERIYTVGRLDYDTSGVLIVTNDGDFANQIVHPRYHLPKTYNLTISGILTSEDIKKLKEGIILEEGTKLLPAKVKNIKKEKNTNQTTFDLIICEGKYHQVKRMMAMLGYEVRRLHRSRIAFLGCSDLKQGEYRILKPFEIKKLKALVNEGTFEHLIKE